MNVYHDEVRRLADLNGGYITSEQLIEEAANPASPLHPYFEWDNAKAAHEHRLDQGRELIASVRYVGTRRSYSYELPAYLRDPSKPAAHQGYIASSLLMSRRDQALEVVTSEIRQVAGRIDRAREIGRGLDLSDEVEAALRGLL